MGAELIVGAALAAAGTVASHQQQRSARRDQQKANRTAEASAAVENARQRRRAIAQARIAQATNLAQEGGSVMASSSAQGVASGLSTQLSANIGAGAGRMRSQGEIQSFRQSAQDALGRASLYQNLGNTALQAGQMYATYGPNRNA